MATNYETWKALAEKELGGASFDDVLVHRTPDGLSIQPLYVEGPSGPRAFASAPLRVCMRADPATTRRPEDLKDHLNGGADALWFDSGDDVALDAALATTAHLVVDIGNSTPPATIAWLAARSSEFGDRDVTIGIDPITAAARGLAPATALPERLTKLPAIVKEGVAKLPDARLLRVSTLQFHDSGADAADEVTLALAGGAAYLRALIVGGVNVGLAAHTIALQVAVGRDTFGELCKLRALRVAWAKVVAAFGADSAGPTPIHAVCSARTQSTRDSWTNMLRVSTQVFAAAIGGADYVAPRGYDEIDGSTPSALGRRVARNTALVLRDESGLGRVKDAAAGSYFFDSFTDAMAREAWSRFQRLESAGGVVAGLGNGSLFAGIEASRRAREERIAAGHEPILGVTDFVNEKEDPLAVPHKVASTSSATATVFANHRDAESFEGAK